MKVLTFSVEMPDEFFHFLENKLPNLGRTAEKSITKELGRQFRDSAKVEVSVSDAPTAVVPDEPKVEAPKPQTPDAEKPKAEEPKLEEPKTEEAKQPDAPEMFRAVMDQTYVRIEGPDYKTKAERPYKKALIAAFKGIALQLGGRIPSQLPIEKLDAFKKACDELYINENGSLEPKCPF